MNEIQEILNSLSKEEQEAVIKILKQQTTGNADLLQELYSEDYEEIPVDIDTFLESPEYLGGSTDNGKAIYPYWRNAYREILEKKKVEMCFSGSIGSGKALSLDSKLVTPSGYIYMRDVKLGDKVAGEDGKFYDVTGVYPQGKQPCYRVYFSDRTHVDCTSEHLWTVIDKSGCRKTITTLEIINSKEYYRIPNLSSAIEYSELNNKPQIRLIGSKIYILPHAEFLAKNIREYIMFAILGLSPSLVNDRTISIKKSILTSDSITTFSNICRSLGCIVSVHRRFIYIDVPPWLMSYMCIQPSDNTDIRNKYITRIKKTGHKEFQCIEVSNPSKLYLTNNYTPTHNTTAAIYLMAYFFYRLMCLKNVRKFYGLEGNGPVCICFLNNTINLSKGVAYDKFMSTVASSPWFLERGEVRGTVNIRYKPNKNIEFIIGSSSDQIIGRDIFCLTGETQIHTENGYQFLEELEDKEVRVYTYDGDTEYLTDEPVKIKCTKFSNVTYVITLSDNTTIRCTWNHKFLTGIDTYTQAIDLEVGMKLKTINSGVLYITDIVCVEYTNPIKLYDVINVEPYHNFVVKTSTNAIISHNCAIIDEVNFSKTKDVQLEKMKILETYNACFGRIKNRFTVNGACQGRIFLVSSKKTEYDFLNQYVEKKMQSKEDAKNLYVADAKAYQVKPEGSYSGKTFRVAVGGSNLPSKIPEDDETTEELRKQGFEVYDAPIELRGDFEMDINRFIADHLGIAVSEVLKFIPYNKVEACFKDIKNPFSAEVVEANLSDTIPIRNYFMPNEVPEDIYRKPIYIHFDTSGGKSDNCGCSAVAQMGFVNRNRYSSETGNMETTKQMMYRHVFSVGFNANKQSEISFQKLIDFIWYLKFELGWNIKAVSTDGYMGQFLRQQITAAGFNQVDYVSLDRTPDGYLTLLSIFSEQRIAMSKLELLTSELVRLERNNITGKIDHPPIDGCFTENTMVTTECGPLSMLRLWLDDKLGISHYVITFNKKENGFEWKKIKKASLTKYVKSLVVIMLENGYTITCTPEHKIFLDTGECLQAKELGQTLINEDKLLVGPDFCNIDGACYIKSINFVELNNEVPVYDLYVVGNHNFQLACGVIVHNSKDISDSLAGAVFNASKHESDIVSRGEDLLDEIVDVSSPLFKVEDKQSDINKIVEDVKEESSKTADKIKQEVIRRQTMNYYHPDEDIFNPNDGILDI